MARVWIHFNFSQLFLMSLWYAQPADTVPCAILQLSYMRVCHLCNVREVQQHRVHVWVLMSLFISHQDCTDYWTSKVAKWTRNTGTLGRVWNLLWRLDHWRLVKWCFLVFISFHTISTHLKHQNAGLWLNVTNVTAAARSAGTFLVLVRFCAPVTVASEKGLQSQILASQKWYQA